MEHEAFSGLSIAEIMHLWPATIGVFIELRLHCVGCPVAAFQTLADAAREHGVPLTLLSDMVAATIAGKAAIRAGPPRDRRQSSIDGAGSSPEASAGHLQRGRRPPRR